MQVFTPRTLTREKYFLLLNAAILIARRNRANVVLGLMEVCCGVGEMRGGPPLVREHLESLIAGRVFDFDAQLTPSFRYKFLPPVLGEGPVQARRWRDILFSIYRDWLFEIEDVAQDGDEVLMRVCFIARDPVEPANTPPIFRDVAYFQFEIVNDKLAGCDALYLNFEEHEEFKSPEAN